MGNTTISVDEETRKRLQKYRSAHHGSFDEQLNGMMDIIPTIEEMKERVNEDGHVSWQGTPERTGGVIHFFHTTVGESKVTHSSYYPTAEAFAEMQRQIEQQVPTEPDEVIVGGKDELRTSFNGARFHIGGDDRWVSLDIPGAFGGSNESGEEYDYAGEPVYIKNAGEIVQQGVVEDIIHEDAHTAITLTSHHATEMLHHPNDRTREEYKEVHTEWHDGKCEDCEGTFRYPESDEPSECPNCGGEIVRESPEDAQEAE